MSLKLPVGNGKKINCQCKTLAAAKLLKMSNCQTKLDKVCKAAKSPPMQLESGARFTTWLQPDRQK